MMSADSRSAFRRSVVFCTGAVVVYLHLGYGAPNVEWMQVGERFYFLLVGAAVVAAIRYSPMRRKAEFKTTGLDYLIALVVVVIPLAAEPGFRAPAGFLVALLILLYALELMLTERREGWHGVGPACALALAIVAAKSLVF
jgi:hypothetical protein